MKCYVIDFIEFLINGWFKDGLLKAETCSHPNSVLNIMLELRTTDCSVDITIGTIKQRDGHKKNQKSSVSLFCFLNRAFR
jgi:hypothetical protein